MAVRVTCEYAARAPCYGGNLRRTHTVDRMQASTLIQACLLVIFALLLCVLEPTSSCNTKLPRPRLLQAKVLFGDAMRVCEKEIVEYAKNIPPHMLHKIIPISCAVYNECKWISQDKDLKPIIDCCISAYQNKSAPFYTRLNLSEAYAQAAEKSLVCILKATQDRRVGLQTLDDGIAFARITALAYGWT
ncbi:uncharacterized protein [Dermacentor andersoni]|uniref:uncharacterized protein isoform X2 n=1 Tax=Dermacentor andersoni TaxID=34620 RepID=UPI002417C6D4|nr:uncharacterized protein LOC129388364 isoform X2 [Dermacentor andersoni]